MNTNAKRQTNKQYRRRKIRIKASQKYDMKIEKATNEIKDIDDQIKRLQLLRKEKVQLRQDIKDEKYQTLLKLYNETVSINEITKLANQTTYSRVAIDDIKNKCVNGFNEDNIDSKTLENIIMLDDRILEQVSHTNVISDVLNIFGESIKCPGENFEDEEDVEDDS